MPSGRDAGGVPAHSLPAMPYRHEDRAAPPPDQAADAGARGRDARDDEDDAAPSYATDVEEAPPPPRPRYYQIRNRDYDDRDYYAPRSYGPPPAGGSSRPGAIIRAPPTALVSPRDPYVAAGEQNYSTRSSLPMTRI